MKKTLITLFAVLISFSGIGAFAYSDVNSDHSYSPAIQYITNEGIVSGYPDGTYKPDNLLNRAELLKIIIESVYEDSNFSPYQGTKCFDDVPINEWYTKYVCFAKDEGIVDGYSDGTFRPGNFINLVETLKITLEVFDYDYPSKNPWYKGIVEEASYRNFIPLDFTRFDQQVTRGQMAELITRVLKYEDGTLDDYLGKNRYLTVTYETLEENINMKNAEIEKIETVYESQLEYRDKETEDLVFKFIISSDEGEEDISDSCSGGYFTGFYEMDLYDSDNDLIDNVELGYMDLPYESLHLKTMTLSDGGMELFLFVEEFADCDGNYFTMYQADLDDEEIDLVEFLDESSNRIYAESIDDIEFDIEELAYEYYDEDDDQWHTKRFDWDAEERGFEDQ